MASKIRNSQGIVMMRCLALLTRLLDGPATTQELVQIVGRYDDQGATTSNATLLKRFEKDRARLENWFGCECEYDRKTATYSLAAVNHPLFDLPTDALRGLAFLQATFSGPDVPMSREVLSLFNTLMLIMPEQRRMDLQRERGLIELDLHPRDKDAISEQVMEAVRNAYSNHQQMGFDYQASSRDDGRRVRHRVEPYRYFFMDGHYYFEAFCLATQSDKGTFTFGDLRRYRIGRMSNPSVLPTKFTPGIRKLYPDELIYELSPEIARLGVTEHFPGSVIERRTDGSAVVKALSTMLFIDLRKLLHYGPGCRVIGGEKAVREMKALVTQMYQRYEPH